MDSDLVVSNSPAATLDSICQLQALMMTLPQVEVEPKHHFGPGVYVRELTIPAGNVAVGKTHGKEHILIIAKGDVTIVTDQGRQRVVGPAVFTSPPGVKRAVYTHEDTTFITIHPTDEIDVDKIEADNIIPDKLGSISNDHGLNRLLEEIK